MHRSLSHFVWDMAWVLFLAGAIAKSFQTSYRIFCSLDRKSERSTFIPDTWKFDKWKSTTKTSPRKFVENSVYRTVRICELRRIHTLFCTSIFHLSDEELRKSCMHLWIKFIFNSHVLRRLLATQICLQFKNMHYSSVQICRHFSWPSLCRICNRKLCDTICLSNLN